MADDYSRTTFDVGTGAQSNPDDSKIFCEFYFRPVVNKIKSREAGRPVHENVEYVKLVQPGEQRLASYDQPATDEERYRFPRQYQMFKNGQTNDVNGTSLTLLFPDNPAIVHDFKFFGCSTVEQLAGMTDSALQNVGPGGFGLRKKAQDYLASAEKGKEFHEINDKIAKMELKDIEKDKIISDLQAALAVRESDEDETQPRRRGRPPMNRAEQAA